MTQIWRSAAPQDLVWLVWGETNAVYHRPSGKTHFVNAATRLLLIEILREPLDVTAASRALADVVTDFDNQPLLVDHVREMLLRLDQLGLIERALP